MPLSIEYLEGTHKQHDKFIHSYLNEDNHKNDIVLNELEEMQEYKRSKTKKKLKTLTPDEDTKIHNLALYILLTQYPKKWWKIMFEAAYLLLVGLLKIIKKNNFLIYPPKWTRKIFRTEQILSPDDINGMIFGIDPLSNPENDFADCATGHAFTFSMPSKLRGLISTSTKGLQKVYFMTKDLNFNSSQTVEDNFICKYGIAMVNYIRTIQSRSKAGSENDFKDAWDEYNYQWLTTLNEIRDEEIKVLIFQNEYHHFEGYAKKTQEILENAPRCSHPSHIRSSRNHCLYIPNTSYSVNLSPTPNTNESVVNFYRFLEKLGAGDVCSCSCGNCPSFNLLTFEHKDFELLKSLVKSSALNFNNYAYHISKLTGNLLSVDQLRDLDSKRKIYNFFMEIKDTVVRYLKYQKKIRSIEQKIEELKGKIKDLEGIENDVDEKETKKKLRNYIDSLEGGFKLTDDPKINDLNSLKDYLKDQIKDYKDDLDEELKKTKASKKSYQKKIQEKKNEMAELLEHISDDDDS